MKEKMINRILALMIDVIQKVEEHFWPEIVVCARS